jgi:hypothetical protein
LETVDAQRLLGVVAAVVPQPPAEADLVVPDPELRVVRVMVQGVWVR